MTTKKKNGREKGERLAQGFHKSVGPHFGAIRYPAVTHYFLRLPEVIYWIYPLYLLNEMGPWHLLGSPGVQFTWPKYLPENLPENLPDNLPESPI